MHLIKHFLILVIISLIFALSSCKHHENTHTIRLGIMEGLETTEWEVAQKIALERYGLHIKLIKF